MLRYEGQGRLARRCDCAAILDHERTGGARPVAGWCILHAGTLAAVTTTTAGVLVLHAEPLCEERDSVGRAAGRGAGPAHGRAAVGDLGRLVGPREADPVQLSYNRPCLRIDRF